MCGNQCGNLHIPDVPYYDRTPILPTLPQRSDAAGVIIQTDTESYRRLAAIQLSARFYMCRVGNNPMVRQKKHDMGKTAPYNAGGIFVCGNSRSFLQCFCLSHKIFFGIKRSCLLYCVFGYFFKTGRNQQAISFRLSLHNCFSEAAQTSKRQTGQLPKDCPVCRFHYCFEKKPLICIFSVFCIAHICSAWYNNQVMHS